MKKIFIFIFSLILLTSFVLAVPDCPRDLPKTYSGIVSFDDDLLLGNYEITAMIGSNSAGVGNVIDGNYQIDISPCSGITGVVYFYIHGIKTEEEGSYVGMNDWGENENLDLTLYELPPSESPLCDDGIKDSGEVCDGDDFGTLTCSNYGFNSGYLTCSDSCDYIYTDNCYNSNHSNDDDDGGSSSGGTTTTTVATSEDGQTIITTVDDVEDGDERIDLISSESQGETGSEITGGVIGFVKSGVGMGLTFAVLLLIVGIAVVGFRKKRKVSKLSKKE